MSNPNQDPKLDRNVEHDHDPANDNGGSTQPGNKTSVPALKRSTAITSLAGLMTAFERVDLSALSRGFASRPLMLFKSRENGLWAFGQKRIEVEADSVWAFNPATFEWGYVCFGADKTARPLKEVLRPVWEDKPDVTKLPDLGFPWVEARAVGMKCLSGADAGVEVTFKTNTDGGVKAIDGLVETVRNRMLSGSHGGKMVPTATLERDSYPHKDHGKIWYPVINITEWVAFDEPSSAPTPAPAPEPAPSSPSPSAEPARRRRVA
jgi:hypothetical protein